MKNIKVTVIAQSGEKFSTVFDSAAKAFVALYEYLLVCPRQCFYTDRLDDLMKLLLDVKGGFVYSEECSAFRVEAFPKEV